MAAPGTGSLRAFFEGLVDGDPPPVPADLYRLARGVLGRGRDSADVDDLVSTFVLKVIEATTVVGAGSAKHLVKLSAPRLRAVVRHRLRQVRAEQCPRWRLVKSIREQVRAALELPAVEAEHLPLALVERGRIRLERVREAVAWVRSHSLPWAGSAREVADRVLALYFPDDVHEDVLTRCGDGTDEDALIAVLDAPDTVQRLRHDLGPRLERVLRQRLQGVALKAIAQNMGSATSTAHEHAQEAVDRVRRRVRRHRLDRRALEPVLEMLGT